MNEQKPSATIPQLSYKDAGVDIDAGGRFLEGIRRGIQSTQKPWVLGGFGDFSGLVDVNVLLDGRNPDGFWLGQIIRGRSENPERPVLEDFEILGREVVEDCFKPFEDMPITPVAFLDYIGASKACSGFHSHMMRRGIVPTCLKYGVPIVGGETAEMRVIHREGSTTLVGYLLVWLVLAGLLILF